MYAQPGYASYLITVDRLIHERVKNSNAVISVLVGLVVFFPPTVAGHVILIQRITLCGKKKKLSASRINSWRYN